MEKTFVARRNWLKLQAVLAFALNAGLCFSQTNVLTWHNDNARTGQNLSETVLSPANVKFATFGKLFSVAVDGKVDAQPLYVSGLSIAGQGPQNVAFAATENDSVYAFNADRGTIYWHVSLLGSDETASDDRNCNQVTPEIGITGTPVIDLTAGPHGTIYLVAMSKNAAGAYFQRLHALDITTGAEINGSPTLVQPQYSGTGDVAWDPAQYKARPGLLLLNGIVYTSWGSHCDSNPYTGWAVGFDELTLVQRNVFNFAPNGSEAAIWASGGGPAADANGNLFFSVANGTFDETLNSAGFPNQGDFGNAFVKLSLQAGVLVAADYWTMYNSDNESAGDVDLGSGGIMLLPDVTDSTGKVRHLAVGAGKDGNLYMVDRDNMGKYDPAGDATIYQQLTGALPGGVWGNPAYYNGYVYFGAQGDYIRAFQLKSARLSTSPVSTTVNTFTYPGITPSISANGTNNAILWAVENSSPAVLHAFDPTDLTTEFYNSDQAPSGRDQFGAGNKFIVPTVANGKVFIGTQNSVAVFGLLAQIMVPNIVGLTQAAASSSISGAGLVVGTVTSVFSNSVASGNVISQNPVANTHVASESAVNLVVSSGPAQKVAPTVDSVTPSTGSGSSQTFTFKFSSVNGYEYLNTLFAVVNSSVGSGNSCRVEYLPATNQLYLYPDAGASGMLLGPMTPGVPGTLSNSQCMLNIGETSAAGVGNTITLKVALTFQTAFAGLKDIYGYAEDLGSRISGWVTVGEWNTSVVQAVTPTASSVTPKSGIGNSQTFTFAFESVNSYLYLSTLTAVINTGVGSGNSCRVEYLPASNQLYLYPDAGASGMLLGPMTPGDAGTLSNSQCTLNVGETSAAGAGNTITLKVALTFEPAFAGPKNIYGYAEDLGNRISGWVILGEWDTAAVQAVAPTANSVTPNSGSSNSQTFTFAFESVNSFLYLSTLTAVVDTGVGSENSCRVEYLPATNQLYLYPDAGASGTLLGPMTPGATATLSNSQCTLNVGQSSAAGAGNTVTLKVALTFQPAFAGLKNIYGYAEDLGNRISGWVSLGTWNTAP